MSEERPPVSCLCCKHSAIRPPHIWHVHPRCPFHGEPEWRGVGLDWGEHYGGCQRDHSMDPVSDGRA